MSLVQMSGKSFTYIINKSGRSTLPCGKCHFVSFISLTVTFVQDYNSQTSEKKYFEFQKSSFLKLPSTSTN